MRNSRMYAAAIGLSSLIALPALAEQSQLQACKKDFEKAGCSPATEGEAYRCLERQEKEGEENEGLTRACYEAHERYEKSHKKGEHHPEQDKGQR